MSPARVSGATPPPEQSSVCDVVVVGAGPAGLMLAANLVRFGIKTTIIDDRSDKTATGRADGLQPKSIETLKQMRLADPLLQRGVKIYDICFWSSSPGSRLQRTGRQIHYPPVVDLLDPYILLVHQGMVEDLFIDDMKARGVKVTRNTAFTDYAHGRLEGEALVRINSTDVTNGTVQSIFARYLVGCDGAHSQVRKCIPGAIAEGSSSDAIWGVLDGVIETDFPDLWSKVVVYSEEAGNVLCIPRERNMTRLYIELRPESGGAISKARATQDFVMDRARQIMKPYSLTWTSVEWFGIYQIGQRVANIFTDDESKVFIAGDASHTHSPKAAQGMNTSMHDSLNLAWKLNLAIRGVTKPALLATYEHERRKIAQDLINFDHEHANAFHDGDAEALAKNFLTNVRFISGVGTEYGANVLNVPSSSLPAGAAAQPGGLLPPAKLTRYIDANPVDAQLDIPMLGQFRMYVLCRDVRSAMPFLEVLSSHILSPLSMIGMGTAALRESYSAQAVQHTEKDDYTQSDRYTAISHLLTLALVTSSHKDDFEIAHLPAPFRESKWTIYLDDIPSLDTRKQGCIDKWVGGLGPRQIAVVNVRPDGYVGSVSVWPEDDGLGAALWVNGYYDGFLDLHCKEI